MAMYLSTPGRPGHREVFQDPPEPVWFAVLAVLVTKIADSLNASRQMHG